MPTTFEASIARIVDVGPETRAFHLARPESARFSFIPGQFISCLLPVGGETLIRPYSIASDPEDTAVLEICLNRIPGGPGSAYLFGLEVGAPIRFTGPWGTFTLDRPPETECVFIADGSGIVPIRPMLRRALSRGGPHSVRLHYAAPSRAHLLYAGELAALTAAHARFTFDPLIGGDLRALIEQRYVLSNSDRSRHFYICGVGDIVPQLRDLLRRAGYERRAVQYEKW